MNYFTYKNRPLVRKGNMIYYGSMAKPYVIAMNILKKDTLGSVEVAREIKVMEMLSEKISQPMEAIKRNMTKPSLYDALELADMWLTSQKC